MKKLTTLSLLISMSIAAPALAQDGHDHDHDYKYKQEWMPVEKVELDLATTAIFFTDPQNDFYSEESPVAALVQPIIKRDNVVENQQRLLKAAAENDMKVLYSPHTYTVNDYKNWDYDSFNGIDRIMFDNNMFIEGTKGHDWYPALAPTEETIVMNPHKGLSNFWTGDAVIQLRQNGIETIILGGMASNMCTESHARDAIENGFKVLIVEDATAAAGAMAKEAAVTNFEFLANQVVTTDQALAMIAKAKK